MNKTFETAFVVFFPNVVGQRTARHSFLIYSVQITPQFQMNQMNFISFAFYFFSGQGGGCGFHFAFAYVTCESILSVPHIFTAKCGEIEMKMLCVCVLDIRQGLKL